MRIIRQFHTLSRPVQLLLLNQLAINTGFYMLMPYLTTALSHGLGFTTWMVGLVVGLRTFSQQGLYVIGGTLSDRAGYKPAIAAGCALRMAGFLLFGFSETLAGMLAAAFVSGLGGAFFAPAVRAYLAAESGEQRVEAFAMFQVTEGMGACLGPGLGVMLFTVSFRWVCIVSSGLFLLLTCLQLVALPPQKKRANSVPQPILNAWGEVLGNRMFVVFALGMMPCLMLSNQLYVSLPLEIRRLTGHDGGTGLVFIVSALLSGMAQMHLTAYVKITWRPLQAIARGLMLMGLAFVPLWVGRLFLPLHAWQADPEPARLLYSFMLAVVNLSPAVISALLLALGVMTLQPFVLSLIPTLGERRLLGTYFGFYYLLQGLGAMVGNLTLGITFDLAPTLGFASLPWLLLLSLGLASALSIVTLDRQKAVAPWQGHARRTPAQISPRTSLQAGGNCDGKPGTILHAPALTKQ